MSLRKKALYLFLILAYTCADARVYFIHIPKTGGTTLRLLLEMQVDQSEIYPFKNWMKAKAAPIRKKLVSGHFPYWFCKTRDPLLDEAFTLTILRDPIERYLSCLRVLKDRDKMPDLESVFKQHPIRPKHHFLLQENSLCRNLAQDPDLEGEALLQSAKETLHKIDCLVFLEYYTEGVVHLFERLGVELAEKDVPKLNFTQPEPVSEWLLEELKRINALDIELYEYAKTAVQEKKTSYLIRGGAYDRLLERVKTVDYRFDQPLKGSGWSYRESIWDGLEARLSRWVMDRPARIEFSLEEEKDYHLYFSAHLLKNEIPHVQVNGIEMEIFRLSEQNFSLFTGKIPVGAISSGKADLTFYPPKKFPSPTLRRKQFGNNPPFSYAVDRIWIQTEPLP